jgi:ribosomal protein S18 acetylase RimI-like enzyme
MKTKQKIIIRKGKLTDAKELLRLMNSSPELQSSPDGNTYTPRWIKSSLTNPINLVLIAEIDDEIDGFLMAELWKDRGNSYLADIYIKPEFRKQGLSTMLQKEFEKICKENNISHIFLLTLTTNKRMQKHIEKKHYKKGNKMFIYEKNL